MSSFSGSLTNFGPLVTPENLTDSFANGADESNTFPISLTSSGVSGSQSGATDVAITHADVDGSVGALFGALIFGRIIVIPRLKEAGFVLSSTQFPVEVWNTFHDDAKSLTDITVTGSGGIVIENPFTLPLSIGPGDSVIFQALLPGSGADVNIDEDVTFVFAGITGTDMRVTGSRILVFSVDVNFDDGVDEIVEYKTDVFKAYDDSETRRSIRTIPRRGQKYTAKAMDARLSAGMESLVWGWQHQPYGVPIWQDQQPLLAPVSPGSFSIEVNTIDRLFAANGIALIYGDEFTFEALTITELTDSSLTFSAPTQFTWKPGARVVPVVLGRLADSVQVTRSNSLLDEIQAEFAGESGQALPSFSSSPTQFKGFDVLEVAPNWANDLERQYDRSMVRLDPQTGPITVEDKGGTAIVSHNLPWWIETHAGVTQLRSFLDRRRGQQVPFWCPTFDADLVLSADAITGDSILNIENVFYTRFFFPDRARRFLALIARDGSGNRFVEVTGSVDNGDGTESLTLSAALTRGVSLANTMISFMTFCRNGDDKFTITWYSTECAEAIVPIREIPRELPT